MSVGEIVAAAAKPSRRGRTRGEEEVERVCWEQGVSKRWSEVGRECRAYRKHVYLYAVNALQSAYANLEEHIDSLPKPQRNMSRSSLQERRGEVCVSLDSSEIDLGEQKFPRDEQQ